MNDEHVDTRIFIVVTTHKSSLLDSTLAGILMQSPSPDGLIVTSDVRKPEIRETIETTCANAPYPVFFVEREHQGMARSGQVRNNGVRCVLAHFEPLPSDALLFLDGDIVLPPDTVSRHLTQFNQGADLVLTYPTNLSAEDSARFDADSILRNDVDYQLRPSDKESARHRQRRYERHLRWRPFGIIPGHKPKIIGNHFAVRLRTFQSINGFDEEYMHYGYEDDDLARRIHSLRPRPRVAVCIEEIPSLHLWHEKRHQVGIKESPGYARFCRKDLPTRATFGLDHPVTQPPLEIHRIT